MYLIKNISGVLSIIGLSPGEAKKILDSELTEKLIELNSKGLISISYIKPNVVKKKEKEIIVKDEVKE